MKTVEYNGERLATNTEAYQMLLQYQRTGKTEDKVKLDEHLRRVNLAYKKLHGL